MEEQHRLNSAGFCEECPAVYGPALLFLLFFGLLIAMLIFMHMLYRKPPRCLRQLSWTMKFVWRTMAEVGIPKLKVRF